MNHFKHAQQEQQRANQILSELCQAAITLGLSERGLNANNAALLCFKALDEYKDLKELANELGTTLPKVLQSYRMRHRGDELIPVELQFAPPHWIREAEIQKEEFWVKGERKYKTYRTKAVSASTAQRLRAGLQSQLVALLTLIQESGWTEEEKSEYLQGLLESYQRDCYEDFSGQLTQELWELTTAKDDEQYKDTRAAIDAQATGALKSN